MPAWIVKCPICETENEISAEVVKIDCGQVTCTCTCINCRNEFDNEQPYWRELGLNETPPDPKAKP